MQVDGETVVLSQIENKRPCGEVWGQCSVHDMGLKCKAEHKCEKINHVNC